VNDDMSAYRDVFFAESAEYLDSITAELLNLEGQPNDLAPVEAVFRGAHSLKGMAAAMGYARTAEFTHRMESVMDPVRKREQPVDESLIDLMLRCVDAVRALIAEESADGPAADVTELSAALDARAARVEVANAPARSAATETASQSVAPDSRPLLAVAVTLADDCALKSVRAYLVLKRLGMLGTVVATEPEAAAIEAEHFGTTFGAQVRTELASSEVTAAVLSVAEVVHAETRAVTEPAAVAATPAPEPPAQASARGADAKPRTVRVPIARFDSLLDLVGELVILRSRLQRTADRLREPDLDEQLAHLASVTGELRHQVMRTRAVPVGSVFNRFPRTVRDLSHRLGKSVDFSMMGLDIEVDRTVLDELSDPLVHMLRNAVDHGIEPPDERQAAGKPPEGTVTLSAYGEAERVRIVVTDDGRGIDVERVWERACSAGLVDVRSRAEHSDVDILALTCLPGLSTAATPTEVSGRGVGMDVVKDRIERLGGAMIMRSTPGAGTEVELVLPLTLAIIQGLLVQVGERTHVLPLSAVSEVLAFEDVVEKSIEGSPVVVVRDEFVAPLFRLDEVLGRGDETGEALGSGERIVLIDVAGEPRALVVDRLLGRQEVVVKPLSPYFSDVHGLAGATVLGDGRIALILDPRTLCETGV
jgi:two-component system chemotaxis sensor kinase CheA